MKSFLDCPHVNVQQFTEVCLDCGYNIYTTEKEYLAELRRRSEVARRRDEHAQVIAECRALEQELGIKRGGG